MNPKKAVSIAVLIIILLSPLVVADVYFNTQSWERDLIFVNDGYQTGGIRQYYVEMDNNAIPGYLNYSHKLGTTKIDFAVTNIKTLWVDLEIMVDDHSDELFIGALVDLDIANKHLLKFGHPVTINVYTDTSMTDVRFFNVMRPDYIRLDGVIYDDWEYVSGTITTRVSVGEHIIKIFYPYEYDEKGLTLGFEYTGSSMFISDVNQVVEYDKVMVRDEWNIIGWTLPSVDEYYFTNGELSSLGMSFVLNYENETLEGSGSLWSDDFYMFIERDDYFYRITEYDYDTDGTITFDIDGSADAFYVYTYPRIYDRLELAFKELLGYDNPIPFY